jgi:hypothetical protein
MTLAHTFVVTRPSAISGTCLLGEGATRNAAIADAYGPKPWSPYVAKQIKSADIYPVNEVELEALREHVHQH